MIGLVMDDQELIERALNGIPATQLPDNMRDDDTGLIKSKTGRAGFLAQLDLSFSPDGYFTEGPYYLRYALSPFLLFGRALADKRPDLNILEYRDGILKKAVYSLLAQADPQGDFFPLNDSQKGMSIYSPEVVKSVDYGYYYFGKDPQLLSLAVKQNQVTLDDAGRAVAAAIANGDAKPFRPSSIAFQDGPDGTEGGVGVLRASGQDEATSCLVMKYSAQGMGHGHFDKLAYSFYNETGEVIQDYGAARWVNIDQKGGGRYLKENNTWAKQSIAHNTLVIGETSHYNGDIRIGEKHHPTLYAFKSDDASFQLISATANANFKYTTNNTLSPMGQKHGYQHLWLEASGQVDTNLMQLNFFQAGTFYTQTSVSEAGDELLFVRLGANDPEFNLRRDNAFVHRRKGAATTTFLSLLETHGSYTPKDEIAKKPFTSITGLQLLLDTNEYTAFRFTNKNNQGWTVLLSNAGSEATKKHSLTIDGQTYQWQGVHHLIKQK